MRLLALVVKEFRAIARNPPLVIVLAYMFLVNPWQSASEFTYAVNRYPIAVYDLDGTVESRTFVGKLREPYFAVQQLVGRDADIERLMRGDAVAAVVVVPEGFAERLRRGETAALQVLGDGTYTPTAQLAGAYVETIAQQFADEHARDRPGADRIGSVDARVRVRFNQALVPEWYRCLEELFQAVILIGLLLPAALMVREKEQGTLEQLLVSPLRRWEITASKVVPTILLASVATLSSLAVLILAFDLPVRGSLPLFMFATMLVVFAMGGYGLVIATISRTMPVALVLTIILIIAFQFLSGNITPVEAMPPWQYYVTLASPQRYYLTIGYGVVLKGASFLTLWREFAGLALMGALTFALGARRFVRQLD